ncbi:hypothetical protein COL93_04165 [Bacillus toyonensis]|nr:hypothetical protein COL93_04165 [Bacillus toyonensis]
MYRLFLLIIQNDGIYIILFSYAVFYALIMRDLMLFYLVLFYILHKNKTTDTIQTLNKNSIKLLNIHY